MSETTPTGQEKPMGMVFDIETIPQQKTLDMEAPPEFLNKGSRSNMSVAKLVEHQEAQEVKWPGEKIKVGSLDWRMGQILSFGLCYWERHPGTTGHSLQVMVGIVMDHDLMTDTDMLDTDEWLFNGEKPEEVNLHLATCDNEMALLSLFWDIVRSQPEKHQVGFNCRDFDCPWLLMRSGVNRLTPSHIWQSGRYSINGRNTDLVDLADALSWFGKFGIAGWNLDRYCQEFGTHHQPRGKGSEVFEHYQAGEFKKIIEHQVYDILATNDLYTMFSGVVL